MRLIFFGLAVTVIYIGFEEVRLATHCRESVDLRPQALLSWPDHGPVWTQVAGYVHENGPERTTHTSGSLINYWVPLTNARGERSVPVVLWIQGSGAGRGFREPFSEVAASGIAYRPSPHTHDAVVDAFSSKHTSLATNFRVLEVDRKPGTLAGGTTVLGGGVCLLFLSLFGFQSRG